MVFLFFLSGYIGTSRFLFGFFDRFFSLNFHDDVRRLNRDWDIISDWWEFGEIGTGLEERQTKNGRG
jgi:hypothetical protein